MRLRAKIALLLVPLVVVPILVLGWFAYREIDELTFSRQELEMAARLEWLAADLSRTESTAVANIRLFANDILVRKYLLTKDEALRYTLLQTPLLRLFRSYQKAFPEYVEIRILLPDGYEEVRQRHPWVANRTEEEGAQPWFQALKQARDYPHVQIAQDPDDGKPVLYVGMPLLFRDMSQDPVNAPEKLYGYLVLNVSLDALLARIGNERVGQNGFLFATDRSGRLLASGATHVDENLAARIFQARDEAKGEGFFRYRGVGTDWFALTRRISPHILVFSLVPESELLVASGKLALTAAGVLALAIALVLFFLYLVVNRLVVRPLGRLREFTRRIGRGEKGIEATAGFAHDEIGELAQAFTDMSRDLSRSYDQIRHLAYHDQLTGLPNRSRFLDMVQNAILDAQRHKEQFALLFLDLDGFKRINDNFGHQVGDMLLQRIAQLLKGTLRGSKGRFRSRQPGAARARDLISRVGGDEFIILLADIDGPDMPGAVAQRIIAILSRPLDIDGHECAIGASIGITLFPQDSEDAGELIRYADIAMYHAKNSGRNTWRYYTPALNAAANRFLKLENRLRRALSGNRLRLAYQPQVDTRNGGLVAVEALARWHDSEEGEISPAEFIAVAERSGLILNLGRWVMEQACRQAVEWQARRPLRVAVNVSPVQFQHQDLGGLIRSVLEETGLSPRLLEIEITESMIMSDPDHSARLLDEIRAMGVSVALDDFGAGYSALSSLRRFPLDVLKIDRGLIAGIDDSREDREIAQAIITMAHTLKLQVVAEGVERRSQAEILRQDGCDLVQGYWLSRPLEAEALLQWLGGDESPENLRWAIR